MEIPLQLGIMVISTIIIMIGYIWNSQGKRIDIVEDHIRRCPFVNLANDLTELKNDMKWIKRNLSNNIKV